MKKFRSRFERRTGISSKRIPSKRVSSSRWTILFIYAICFALLLSGVPALTVPVHAEFTPSSSPSPSAKPDKSKDNNSVTEEKKVSGKLVKKPPYVITVNSSIDKDLTGEMWNLNGTTYLNLLGKRDERKI